MYRCLECKTVYRDKVEYCKCGNNVFEEVPTTPQVQEKITTSQDVVESSRQLLTPAEILSYVVFGACCVLSIAFVMFYGPETQKKEAPAIVEKAMQTKEIPSIDDLWNDTPAYTVHANVSMEDYVKDLVDTLMANFELPKFDGGGSCEIEFELDSVGRLSKKKLIRNSANKPLENAAKKMLSNVKRVTPPPRSYDGEVLRFEFYEQNNQYYLRSIE